MSPKGGPPGMAPRRSRAQDAPAWPLGAGSASSPPPPPPGWGSKGEERWLLTPRTPAPPLSPAVCGGGWAGGPPLPGILVSNPKRVVVVWQVSELEREKPTWGNTAAFHSVPTSLASTPGFSTPHSCSPSSKILAR